MKMFGSKKQINRDTIKGSSYSLTEHHRVRSSELWKLPSHLDQNGESGDLETKKVLAPHSSMGRTCISITSCSNSNYDAQSVNSLKIINNLSRLKAAYKYLTPTIDDIICQATSHSQKEFQELMSKRKPICSISYSQYILAYEASELINQVGREFGSSHHQTNLCYQNDITVNTMQGGREGILENIERLADRIFIDRELMKQLVDLHQLITETITKLKNSLDQVNIEGLIVSKDTNSAINVASSDASNKREHIDRGLIRQQIAKNFIVVGEPRNLACNPDSDVGARDLNTNVEYHRQLPKEIREFLANTEKGESRDRDLTKTISPQRQTMTTYKAHIKNQMLDNSREEINNEMQMQEQAYQRSECSSKCSGMSKKKSKERKKRKEWAKHKDSFGCKMTRRRREKANVYKKEPETEIAFRNYQPNVEPADPQMSIKPNIIYDKTSIINMKCPNVKCARNIDINQLSPSQLDAIAIKSASFTVGVKAYDLKCRNKVGQACAVAPQGNRASYDNESIVMADSGTDIITELSDAYIPRTIHQLPVGRGSITPRPSLTENVRTFSHCTQDCQTTEVSCSKQVEILKAMIAKIADRLFHLQKTLDIKIDQGVELCHSPELCDLREEKSTLLMVMSCLNELEKITRKLFSLNFLEVDGIVPSPIGCCYKDYAHVHAEVIGIPITIKISPTLLAILVEKYHPELGSKTVRVNTPTEPSQKQYPNKDSKSCTCKPATLKSLLKERCAFSKMFKISNKNKLVMNINPIYNNLFDFDTTQETKPRSAFQERELDRFEVLNLQESNTSLPYVVNRHSLPNITTCSALAVDIAVLRKHCRNVEVEHNKPRIERQLQEIGFDNLMKAALPAKCCPPVGINAMELDSSPFHASLISLPLTTSDLMLIADTVEEENYRLAMCNYRAITCTTSFKFEYYTNFQENFASNCDYFIPKMRTRVYLVCYFEIFKKEQQVYRGAASPPRPTSSSYHNDHHNDVRSRSPSRDHHPSRSIISELFRKFMFSSSDHATNIQMPDSNYSGDENDDPSDMDHKNKAKKKQIKGHQSTRERPRSVRRRKQRSKRPESPKGVKNRRLQADLIDLDQYIQAPTTPEDEFPTDAYGRNKISSSIKNYTVSTMTCTKTNIKYPDHQTTKINDPRTPTQKYDDPLIPSHLNKTHKSAKTRSMVNAGVQHSIRKKSAASKLQISINKKTQHNRLFEEDNSDLSLSPTSLSETNEPSYAYEGDTTRDEKSNPSRNKHPKEDKITPSAKNLGTIYESDEKATTKDFQERNSAYSSFYEFLRTPEVSKSFQRFITNEKCNEKLTADQFWHLFLKSRYEAQHSASKTVSMSSTVDDTEMKSEVMELPQKSKTFIKLKSRIPRRTKSYTDSSSDISSAVKVSRKLPKCYNKVPSSPSSINKKPEGNHTESYKETKVYFAEVLDDASKNYTNKLVSMQSLQVLANSNGPGYITVLHPVCGCPEVSIFIPCYCEENGRTASKQCKLTPKKITHLTAKRDGRHIVLPSTCRIPRLREEYKTTKKFQSKESR